VEEEGSETMRLGGRRGALLNGERSCIKARPNNQTGGGEHPPTERSGVNPIKNPAP
jgi:hypothetical protein